MATKRMSLNVYENPAHRGMGLGSPTQNSALGGPFQPMQHRQDADATKPHGQDADATKPRGQDARATFHTRSLILSLLVLGLFGGSVAHANLVGWWKLDGNALDSSGHGRDGVLYGGPVWVPGISGQALQFDGVDDRVEMPGTSQAAGFPANSGEVTWAMWIKASPGAGSQTILCQGPVGAAHVQGNRSVNVEPSGAVMVRAHSVAALTSLRGCLRRGGSVKAEGLGDGRTTSKTAIAKLRLTLPPSVQGASQTPS